VKPASEVMPAATAALFAELRQMRFLSSFRLIGGTALSLHLGHRRSEDLDFITLGSRLPRAMLEALVNALAGGGWEARREDGPAAWEEFEIAGMDLHDYSQTFVFGDAVKVTFFTADSSQKRLLEEKPPEAPFRIATVPELFGLKALVCAGRSNSRDWLDLYLLMKDFGFDFRDWHDVYRKAGMSDYQMETALRRLVSGRPSRDDPGFETLLPLPPSLAEITAFFKAKIRDYEVASAAGTLGKRPAEGG